MKRLLWAVATLLAAAPATAADPAYLALLRSGADASLRGEHAVAARHLRLACFGLLEEPPLLAEGLVRLGLAQAATGDREGFGDTFHRLAEVEERFHAYAAAEIPTELRAAFEAEVIQRIPPAALAHSPAFGALAERRLREEIERLPAGRRRKEIERRLKSDPENPVLLALYAEAEAQAPPRRGRQTPATAGPPQPTPDSAALAPPAGEPREAEQPPRPGEELSPAAAAQLRAARAALDHAQRAPELNGTLAQARRVADAHPQSREAQHLVAEIAYRASRFAEAAGYFRRGGEPLEPKLLFYYAVSLYESGDRSGAAAALERCLPRLQRTPYVESYAGKILGSGSHGS